VEFTDSRGPEFESRSLMFLDRYSQHSSASVIVLLLRLRATRPGSQSRDDARRCQWILPQPYARCIEKRIANRSDYGGQDFLASAGRLFVDPLNDDRRDGGMLTKP